VEAPGRTFPRALAGAVVLVVAMYVLPLAACLGVMPAATDWQLGFFATVAGQVGGTWLSWALVAAAAVSQVRVAFVRARAPETPWPRLADMGFVAGQACDTWFS